MRKFAIAVLAITITAVSVHAAPIFSDNFNSENGGIPTLALSTTMASPTGP